MKTAIKVAIGIFGIGLGVAALLYFTAKDKIEKL